MGRQIIKQPNGKFCVFSSIVDNIISYDMTEEDIINEFVAESREDIERRVKEIISQLNNNEKPYYQFTHSYEEMLKTIKNIHGEEEADEVRKAIGE
jgi:enoyl reductase-like protein